MAQRQFSSNDTDEWLDKYGDGGDGAKTISSSEDYDGSNEACSGTSGSKSVTLAGAGSFANDDLVLIHQSRGVGTAYWELNKIVSGAGTTSLTMEYDLMNTYFDAGNYEAQMLEMKRFTDLTINVSRSYSPVAWNQNTGGIIAFFCNGTLTITGELTASYEGYLGGGGSNRSTGAAGDAFCGEGSAGPSILQQTANGNGGGGGEQIGNDGGAGGAGGGNSAAGEDGANGQGSGGDGGNSIGSTNLTDMSFGGGGGGGCGESNAISNGTGGGYGGAGGGIVFVIAKNIVITGDCKSVGDDGSNGDNTGSNEGSGGGGGGAGGSIFLKGDTIDIGTNNMLALGGQYGSGGNSPLSGNGGEGALGRIRIEYGTSFTGSSVNPTPSTAQDSVLALDESVLDLTSRIW